MKKFTLALIPFFILACASQQNTVTTITGKNTIESECPTEGTCNVEVLKDKSLFVVQNENSVRPYYELHDAPGKLVVRYTYAKKKNPLYQDDIYSEEVVFETDSELSNLKKSATPKSVNMLFGVRCFCRDKAGYYNVDGGSITYKNDKLQIMLPADIIDNQLTKIIKISFK